MKFIVVSEYVYAQFRYIRERILINKTNSAMNSTVGKDSNVTKV
jgi:hypothetical protein